MEAAILVRRTINRISQGDRDDLIGPLRFYFNFIVSPVKNGVKREFGLSDEFRIPPAAGWTPS
jgi:hypothetical protein